MSKRNLNQLFRNKFVTFLVQDLRIKKLFRTKINQFLVQSYLELTLKRIYDSNVNTN
jgi:isocitrate dehydrogenase kinase/phosphatase